MKVNRFVWIIQEKRLRKMIEMCALKLQLFYCGILIIAVVNLSHQATIAPDENQIESTPSTATATSYWISLKECLNKQSSRMANCIYQKSMIELEQAIESNDTWDVTNFLVLKKNENWHPSEQAQGRHLMNPIGAMVKRLSDLVASRTIQFVSSNGDDDGDDDEVEDRAKHGGISNGLGVIGVGKFARLLGRFARSMINLNRINSQRSQETQQERRHDDQWFDDGRNDGSTVSREDCISGRCRAAAVENSTVVFYFSMTFIISISLSFLVRFR